jgi:hypothetical protein
MTQVWLELLKVAPGVVTAVTAIFGLGVARAGLQKWRTETIGKRKAELAEQALVGVYEARDVFTYVRSRALFGDEGKSRKADETESDKQKRQRDVYFVPVERLNREKEVFAKLQAVRYAFEAHFGPEGVVPFGLIHKVHVEIMSAAQILIEITPDERLDGGRGDDGESDLRNVLGWGPRPRPDELDLKIDEAVALMEAVCRPVLSDRLRS